MKRPGRLCALACILSVNFAGMPFARADDLQKAIEAVKGVSDEALRKEFERRFSKKKSRTRTIMAVPRSANTAEAPNPVLASVGDAALVEATHATSRAIYGKDHREDLYEISAAEGIQPLVRASAALFKAVDVDAPAGGMVHLRGKPVRESQHLPNVQSKICGPAYRRFLLRHIGCPRCGADGRTLRARSVKGPGGSRTRHKHQICIWLFVAKRQR